MRSGMAASPRIQASSSVVGTRSRTARSSCPSRSAAFRSSRRFVLSGTVPNRRGCRRRRLCAHLPTRTYRLGISVRPPFPWSVDFGRNCRFMRRWRAVRPRLDARRSAQAHIARRKCRQTNDFAGWHRSGIQEDAGAIWQPQISRAVRARRFVQSRCQFVLTFRIP